MNGYDHAIAVPGESLVDGVIHNLENHVMEPAAIVGIADVHSGTLTNRVESL
jgi:hypothetical protein